MEAYFPPSLYGVTLYRAEGRQPADVARSIVKTLDEIHNPQFVFHPDGSTAAGFALTSVIEPDALRECRKLQRELDRIEGLRRSLRLNVFDPLRYGVLFGQEEDPFVERMRQDEPEAEVPRTDNLNGTGAKIISLDSFRRS